MACLNSYDCFSMYLVSISGTLESLKDYFEKYKFSYELDEEMAIWASPGKFISVVPREFRGESFDSWRCRDDTKCY
jgi:hypothetical protein